MNYHVRCSSGIVNSSRRNRKRRIFLRRKGKGSEKAKSMKEVEEKKINSEGRGGKVRKA